jgi:hypothetical protein
VGKRDRLLDRFLPRPEAVERYELPIRAPAAVVFEAFRAISLENSAVIRLLMRARRWLMGSRSRHAMPRRPLLSMANEIGWGLLAEARGREFIYGAVTRPWEADVTFQALPPAEFACFSHPGFAKIA